MFPVRCGARGLVSWAVPPTAQPDQPSALFDPEAWVPVAGFTDLTDITYHRAVDTGAVRIAFDRPEVRNAFRPHTVDELYRTLDHARQSADVGCVLLTGNGPSPGTGAGRSARAATSASGAAAATSTPAATPRTPSTPPAPGGCTSWSASGSSGSCRRW